MCQLAYCQDVHKSLEILELCMTSTVSVFFSEHTLVFQMYGNHALSNQGWLRIVPAELVDKSCTVAFDSLVFLFTIHKTWYQVYQSKMAQAHAPYSILLLRDGKLPVNSMLSRRT